MSGDITPDPAITVTPRVDPWIRDEPITAVDVLANVVQSVFRGEGMSPEEMGQALRDLAEWYDPRGRFALVGRQNRWESVTLGQRVDVS